MATITGTPSKLNSEFARANGFSGTYEVGRYVFTPMRRSITAKTLRWIVVPNTECPYCNGPLSRIDPRDAKARQRVTYIRQSNGVEHDAVLDVIPRRTHWAVSCRKRCRVTFVMPIPRGRKRNRGAHV